MTTPSPTPEVPLPEPDVMGLVCNCEYASKYCDEFHSGPKHFTRDALTAYADARAAHAVKLERERVVAWLQRERLHPGANPDTRRFLGDLAESIERGDHLPTEESPHA